MARMADAAALCFVDLLLLLGFRGLDHLLFLALGLIDRRVTLAFGGENHRALLPLRSHLLFHRVEYALWRGDVLDLVAQDLHTPGVGGLVQFVHDLDVDVGPLFERAVQLDFSDLAAQRRLRQLNQSKMVVADAIGCPLRDSIP